MKWHLTLALLLTGIASTATALELSDADAQRIGKLLWQNECGGTIEGLTSWNRGESFASLGIGHFIWYPPGQEGPFKESFPQLIAYMMQEGVECPHWLRPPADCPWSTWGEFQSAQKSARMSELRRFLGYTVSHQARFAALRLKNALPTILEQIPEEDRESISAKFSAVAAHPHGHYVLLDYVNFKGEGTNPEERYQGQGWGLLQVLETMSKTAPGAPAVNAFSDAAIHVLDRRIKNSPPERGEQRWRAGWVNRCRTYRDPDDVTAPLPEPGQDENQEQRSPIGPVDLMRPR